MQEITAINWAAVLVGFVVAFGLGFLWYGKLFNRVWASGHGFDGPPATMPWGAMGLQAAGVFLLSWLFAITAEREMLTTAIMIVLLAACLIASSVLYAMKPARVAAIEAGYVVAAGIVLVIVNGVL